MGSRRRPLYTRARARLVRASRAVVDHHLLLDTVNLVRYGRDAPMVGMRAWLDPATCERALAERFKRDGPIDRSATGRVLAGDWDLGTRELRTVTKIRYAIAHWRDGVPWEETGVYAYMLRRIRRYGKADGCTTLEHVVERYRRLDEVFAVVASERRLRPRCEVPPDAVRETGGVYVHFGRDGRPIFGLGGFHRLAMSLALDLQRIPVQVGVVHRDGIRRWRDHLLG